MPPDDDPPICKTCGKPFREGEPRFRTPDGESHVRCHEGPRVLVVEDDSVLLELIVDVVRRVGYITDHAANGEEALRQLPAHAYDLILCDLQMPTMDGPAFYREVQQRFPDATSRIVFMTAHQNLDEFVPFLKEVRAQVLEKPFGIDDLRSTGKPQKNLTSGRFFSFFARRVPSCRRQERRQQDTSSASQSRSVRQRREVAG